MGMSTSGIYRSLCPGDRMMANNDELLQKALKDTLEKNGVLGEVKARLRCELYHAMDDCAGVRGSLHANKEVAFINELIREYLLRHNYKYSASVFECEAGLTDVPMDREYLANEIKEVLPTNVPLLQSVVRRNMVVPDS